MIIINPKEYEEIFGLYEPEDINCDGVALYATKEECENCMNNIKEHQKKIKDLEEAKWKKAKITFSLEGDERYCYYDKSASLSIYVDKDWSEHKIRKYIKDMIFIDIDLKAEF